VKRFITLVLFFISMTLHAASHGKQESVTTLFNQNVHAMNAIVKRGDYDKMDEFDTTLQEVRKRLELYGQAKILEQLNDYDAKVRSVSASLVEYAPSLQKDQEIIIAELESFNRRISSIGLAELIKGWRELGRLKKAFVREPQKNLQKDFETKWLYVSVLIEELYLDEEVETPMLQFLQRYKSVFDSIAAAYKESGFDNVATLKPLSYKIKSDIMMIPRQI